MKRATRCVERLTKDEEVLEKKNEFGVDLEPEFDFDDYNLLSDIYEDEDEPASYEELLEAVDYVFEDKKSKTAKWLLDICDRLYAQNRQVKSLYDEARYLFGELGLTTFAELMASAKGAFESYQQNQLDAARYLEEFYIDYSDYCGDPDRLKPSLKDLVQDNDKLVLGLEQVVTLLREHLAKARHDETPDHLTDFTALEKLQQDAGKVIAEAERKQQQAEAREKDRQELELEIEQRMSRVPRITVLDGETPLLKTKSEADAPESEPPASIQTRTI